MKQFFKTMGYGLIHMFMSAMALLIIALSYVGFFVKLPGVMGINAVGIFALSIGLLAFAGLIIYALGFNMAKVNEEKENVQ